jgi:uncharacterized protein
MMRSTWMIGSPSMAGLPCLLLAIAFLLGGCGEGSRAEASAGGAADAQGALTERPEGGVGGSVSGGEVAEGSLSGQVSRPEPRTGLSVEDYVPRSTLRVPENPVTRARFPFVDVHGHQRGVRTPEQVRQLVREMDELNMAVMVNLSGGSGEALVRNRESLQISGAETRFVVFANLDFDGIDDPEWGPRAAERLDRDVREGGAAGLKIFKDLGMDLLDGEGNRIPTDDPRFDPVWERAGALGIPVLIHTGEPIAFFDPIDETNERWLELTQFPNRARPADRYPSWETVMGEQHQVFRNHPGTTFINAHLGWMGNDLARLGRLLDELPNVHVELGAVIYEIGRQPRFGREFFERYQDRILMGKDSYAQDEFHVYFRIFETEDEYFDYYRRRHAFWQMYGMGLPDRILRKVYYENALRVIPGLDPSLFPG